MGEAEGTVEPARPELPRPLKILIATPIYNNNIHPAFMESVIGLIAHGLLSGQYVAEWKHRAGVGVGAARRDLARVALGAEADYIFWHDDDMVMPFDTISKLLAHQKDIVGGLYFHRRGNIRTSMIYNMDKNGNYNGEIFGKDRALPTGIVECDATGTGALLMKCSVFDGLPQPWFYVVDGITAPEMTEDIWFFDRLKMKHGDQYKIWVDCDVQVVHLTEAAVRKDGLMIL
jgi:hypothetical protein